MTDAELRDIDAAVHRKVFGFTDLRRLPTFVAPDCGNLMVGTGGLFGESSVVDWCYLPKYDHDSTGDEFCEVVPRYSDDMREAWSVVEKLTEGQYVKVRCSESHFNGSRCHVIAADPTQRLDGDVVVADGDSILVPESCVSMPLAICIAALQSVRGAK